LLAKNLPGRSGKNSVFQFDLSIARLYTDPASSETIRSSALVTFQAIHQYGGVVIGEHIGQFMTVLWMALISGMMLRSALFRGWQGWLGLGAALVYLLAQSELLATVIPGFPIAPEAGLIGSLLWLLWMTVMGVALLHFRPVTAAQPTLQAAAVGAQAN
jgi:hypothetical protein